MDFRFQPEQEAFRQEVRAFLHRELPEELTKTTEFEEMESDQTWAFARQFTRKLGAQGWLGMTWPRRYGGQARTSMEQVICNEEMAYHRAPTRPYVNMVTWVGPAILLFGSEEQKRTHLPQIARGEVAWCTGYSEPGAGSDLAGLQTRAVRDGDEYLISGQKLFTSMAHLSDYSLLAARTDPEAPKHRGLSLFVVPLRAEGITIRPLANIMGLPCFCQVFLDGVRVPKENLIGEENQGWYQLATSLDFERSAIAMPAACRRNLEELVDYATALRHRGQPLVRHRLAERAVEIEVGRMLSYRVAWMQSQGLIPNYEASMAKLYGSHLVQRLASTGLQLLGLYGPLRGDSRWARLKGRMERLYLGSVALTIGGGTSEIQRNIIALRGLGLPP